MYHPTTRVLTVLELLQSHQRLSGPDLARRLEVDVRTARRYITMLQDMGIPIEAERGRYGAYRLRPGFKLPPLMFSEDEALALVLGLLTARHMGLTATAPAVEGALAKVERVLPTGLRERLQALQQTLVIDAPTAGRAPSSEIMGLFGEAAGLGRQVFLRYRSRDDQETARTVDPYGLVVHAGRWYAVCYCHLRDGLRMFRLDRVLEAELREDTFTRPADFDSLSYVINSIARSPGSWEIEALLETTLEEAQRTLPATLGTLEAVGGSVVLRAYVEELGWVARVLGEQPFAVHIHKPGELRTTLRMLGEKLLAMAEGE